MTITKDNQASGFLLVGSGGGASYYPGIYSISRGGAVHTVFAAYNVSVTASTTQITVSKDATRTTCVWIDWIH